MLSRSARWRALCLLFLLSHAFLVSATHFHRVDLGNLSATDLSTSVASDSGQLSTNEAASHTQCLLCRLQRGFISDFERNTPSLLRPQIISSTTEHTRPAFSSRRAWRLLRGRAPPSA